MDIQDDSNVFSDTYGYSQPQPEPKPQYPWLSQPIVVEEKYRKLVLECRQEFQTKLIGLPNLEQMLIQARSPEQKIKVFIFLRGHIQRISENKQQRTYLQKKIDLVSILKQACQVPCGDQMQLQLLKLFHSIYRKKSVLLYPITKENIQLLGQILSRMVNFNSTYFQFVANLYISHILHQQYDGVRQCVGDFLDKILPSFSQENLKRCLSPQLISILIFLLQKQDLSLQIYKMVLPKSINLALIILQDPKRLYCPRNLLRTIAVSLCIKEQYFLEQNGPFLQLLRCTKIYSIEFTGLFKQVLKRCKTYDWIDEFMQTLSFFAHNKDQTNHIYIFLAAKELFGKQHKLSQKSRSLLRSILQIAISFRLPEQTEQTQFLFSTYLAAAQSKQSTLTYEQYLLVVKKMFEMYKAQKPLLIPDERQAAIDRMSQWTPIRRYQIRSPYIVEQFQKVLLPSFISLDHAKYKGESPLISYSCIFMQVFPGQHGFDLLKIYRQQVGLREPINF